MINIRANKSYCVTEAGNDGPHDERSALDLSRLCVDMSGFKLTILVCFFYRWCFLLHALCIKSLNMGANELNPAGSRPPARHWSPFNSIKVRPCFTSMNLYQTLDNRH